MPIGGATPTGAGERGKTQCSTSFTSAASHRKERSERRSAKLDALVELGVTGIELMPVADFPGKRNWGYDGVQLFAPDSSYGRPEDLKALVDAAHSRGLMVFLDVIYNHFGPEGNYWPACAPIFTERHQTPWGAAVNFDAEGSDGRCASSSWQTRSSGSTNTIWTGSGSTRSTPSSTTARRTSSTRSRCVSAPAPGDRRVHLILENEENRSSRLKRGADGAPLEYTAQWNDDLHHVLHTAVTGESAAYYESYHGDTEKLGRALAEGFAYQGETDGASREARAASRARACRRPPSSVSSRTTTRSATAPSASG